MGTKLLSAYQHYVTVPWPYERTIQNERGHDFRTCDPNELMRPELELIVGKQGVDWDWDICRTQDNAIDVFFDDAVEAVKFKLVWS
jgi:hypothetical protein